MPRQTGQGYTVSATTGSNNPNIIRRSFLDQLQQTTGITARPTDDPNIIEITNIGDVVTVDQANGPDSTYIYSTHTDQWPPHTWAPISTILPSNIYRQHPTPSSRSTSSQEEIPDHIRPILYRYHSENRPSLYFCATPSQCKPRFSENAQEGLLYLGFELEFDSRYREVGRLSNKKDLVLQSNKLFDNRTFLYYMYDGSLHQGLEMISQPATFEFHLENYEKYKELFKIVEEHGFKSQSYQSCGLHIHFNQSFYFDDLDVYTVNLLYLIERFWRELVLLSRRNYRALVRWANKFSKNANEVWDDYKKSYYLPHHERYHALNLTNMYTYEFRMYKGTLDVEDFFATLELTKNLIMLAKIKTMEELKVLDWNEVVCTSERLIKYNQRCHRKNALKKLPPELK